MLRNLIPVYFKRIRSAVNRARVQIFLGNYCQVNDILQELRATYYNIWRLGEDIEESQKKERDVITNVAHFARNSIWNIQSGLGFNEQLDYTTLEERIKEMKRKESEQPYSMYMI